MLVLLLHSVQRSNGGSYIKIGQNQIIKKWICSLSSHFTPGKTDGDKNYKLKNWVTEGAHIQIGKKGVALAK